MTGWFLALCDIDWSLHVFNCAKAYNWTPRQTLEESTLTQMMVCWQAGHDKGDGAGTNPGDIDVSTPEGEAAAIAASDSLEPEVKKELIAKAMARSKKKQRKGR